MLYFFSFDVNTSAKDIETVYNNLSRFVHCFIDLLCTARITSSYKNKSEKLRADYDKVRAKELAEKSAEEMRQKKADQAATKKTSKSLTREQLQRQDEKDKKESAKKSKKEIC